MTWLSSLLIAVLTGVFGVACTLAVFSFCQSWYRISNFEGAAGYLMIVCAALGGVVAFAVGLIAARLVAAGVSPGFFKGLGVACGAVLALSLIAAVILWARSESGPKLPADKVVSVGRSLVLAVEVRGPKNFAVTTAIDESTASAGMNLLGVGPQPTGKFRLSEAKEVDGQWIVPATMPFISHSRQIFLEVRFSAEQWFRFALPLRRVSPKEIGGKWSEWIESEPGPAGAPVFSVRYRVE